MLPLADAARPEIAVWYAGRHLQPNRCCT